MNRICVIDVPGLSLRMLRQVENLWISSPGMSPACMKPVFPALCAPMQATLTTGAEPGSHGIVAGGIFRRESCRIGLDERSNTLLAKKRLWHSRSMHFPKAALLMWSHPLAGAADVVLGAMCYGPGGVSLCDQPVGLYGEVMQAVGPCDASMLRGPDASWAASSWIVSAAEFIWRRHEPAIQWVYLPGLDFEIVRHGLGSPQAKEALRVMDLLAHRLAESVRADGSHAVVLSNGGYVETSRVGFPNLQLAQAGLIRLRPTDLGQMIDLENSQAVAMVDHQIAHVYCKDASAKAAAADALKNDPAVARVLGGDEAFAPGMGRDRAGDLVVLSHADAWLHYRWWFKGDDAPRAAARWDVAGKCGYDPCELFAPAYGTRECGQIDPNPNLVRASRGLVPPDEADWPVIASGAKLNLAGPILATAVGAAIRQLMTG